MNAPKLFVDDVQYLSGYKGLEFDLLQVAICKYLSVATTNLQIPIYSTRQKLPRTSHRNSQVSISSVPFQKPYRQKGLINGEKLPHFIHFNDVHKKSEHASQWPIETISNYLQTHSELNAICEWVGELKWK